MEPSISIFFTPFNNPKGIKLLSAFKPLCTLSLEQSNQSLFPAKSHVAASGNATTLTPLLCNPCWRTSTRDIQSQARGRRERERALNDGFYLKCPRGQNDWINNLTSLSKFNKLKRRTVLTKRSWLLLVHGTCVNSTIKTRQTLKINC